MSPNHPSTINAISFAQSLTKGKVNMSRRVLYLGLMRGNGDNSCLAAAAAHCTSRGLPSFTPVPDHGSDGTGVLCTSAYAAFVFTAAYFYTAFLLALFHDELLEQSLAGRGLELGDHGAGPQDIALFNGRSDEIGHGNAQRERT